MKTIKMLNQKGTFYRINGMIQAVHESNCSPDVVEAIRKLRTSKHDVLNIRESDFAIAADYLLTGAPYESNRAIDYLIDCNMVLK